MRSGLPVSVIFPEGNSPCLLHQNHKLTGCPRFIALYSPLLHGLAFRCAHAIISNVKYSTFIQQTVHTPFILLNTHPATMCVWIHGPLSLSWHPLSQFRSFIDFRENIFEPFSNSLHFCSFYFGLDLANQESSSKEQGCSY